jgi:hypothetical protein
MVMPVAPMYGNNGMGFNGDWSSWIILFLIFGMFGGWGNGFGGGGFDGGLYPWMNNSNQINGGFRDQMLNTSVQGIQNGITAGFGDVQSALCGGFAGVNASINGAQNAISAQMYGNTIADLERSFAAQTAQMQGMNGLQSQLAQCCCDNRAATADLKYTVATENCADRTAAAQNTRDIIDAQTRGTQAILDKLCALELDGVKGQLAQAQRENVGLQNQLNMATLRESQTAQNAFIQQGFSNEVDALYNRLNSCPVPTTPVYGRTPIFTCPGQNTGCGCGCGNGAF